MRTELRLKYREKYPRMKETQTPEDERSLVLKVQLFPLKIVYLTLSGGIGRRQSRGPSADT